MKRKVSVEMEAERAGHRGVRVGLRLVAVSVWTTGHLVITTRTRAQRPNESAFIPNPDNPSSQQWRALRRQKPHESFFSPP